jgi:hypothetical protein
LFLFSTRFSEPWFIDCTGLFSLHSQSLCAKASWTFKHVFNVVFCILLRVLSRILEVPSLTTTV